MHIAAHQELILKRSKMSNPSSIPPHWQIKTLEELLSYVIGGDWGKDENYQDSDFELAYCIRGSEIRKWDEEKGRTASLRKIKRANIEKRKLIEGDILVEISGGGPDQPVGRTVLIDRTVLSFNPEIPKICTNFLRLIRPLNDVYPKLLNYYLKYFYYTGDISKYQAGSNNLRNLKFPDYLKIPIPLPPLPEQQAIVAKIEQLFSELDKGIDNLRLAQQQLKTYRQSVLKWAFEGKLTNENVKEGELPEGWKWVKLGELLESVKNGYSKKPDDKGSKKILRISSVRPNSVDFSDIRYLENDLSTEYEVSEGDLIFTRYNGSLEYVGVCGRVPLLKEKIYYPDKLIRCRPKIKTDFHSKYLQYASNSGEARMYILSKLKTTAGQTGIAGSEIKQIPIPLPSIEEQQHIVSELESRLTVCDKLEESIAQSLQQAEALRQSILKRSFEGKLLP